MDIRTLQSALARLAEDRAEDPLQAPKNIALSLGAEAGILLSLFRGLTERQGLEDDVAREVAADALTSILVHVAQLSNHVGLDASAGLRARIKGKPAPALSAPNTVPVIIPRSTPDDADPPAKPAPPAAAAAASAETQSQSPEVATAAPASPAPSVPVAAASAPSDAPPPVAKPAPRKRGGGAVVAVKVEPTVVAREHAAKAAVEVVEVVDEPAPLAPQLSVAAPEPDPHEGLEPETVLEFAKEMSRQLDLSTRDDPVLRDLRDELETLRRSLYASNTKKAWIAGSLKSLRDHLRDALPHSFAEEVRAADFIRRIDGLLER